MTRDVIFGLDLLHALMIVGGVGRGRQGRTEVEAGGRVTPFSLQAAVRVVRMHHAQHVGCKKEVSL